MCTMRTLRFPFAGVLGLILMLSACEGVRDQLGVNKQPPDEFRVQAQAPLSMPPNFFETPPPQPGVARPQEGTVQQQARRSIFRSGESEQAPPVVAPNDTRSPGEQALLAAAGADRTPDGIREIINQETEIFNESDKRFLDYIVFWRDEEQPGVVVDAGQEARRLRENAALGRTAVEGQTPTIERKRKALLEGIF